MKQKIALMRKVLDGLLEEVEKLSEQIKTKGVVPREICELCRVNDKRTIVEFLPRERKTLDKFKEWRERRGVIGIERMPSITTMSDEIHFKTSKKLKKRKTDAEDEKGYVYSWSASSRSKRFNGFLEDPEILRFILKWEMVETCPHLEKPHDNILKIGFRKPYHYTKLAKEKTAHKIFLCCDECKQRVEDTLCDRVHKRGFLFDHACSLKDIILRKRLSQNELKYEDLEEQDESIPLRFRLEVGRSYPPIYYLRQNSTVILLSRIGESEKHFQDIVKYLKPELIVAFDDHTNLPSYLEFETNILFYSENGMFFYDKDRQPETNTQRICEKIASVLNTYIETKRGKEHDRIVSSLYSIGQDLGYVPQLEYNKSGVRIDCVWFNREGNIQVALEVETSSTWKKDIISTWEVEPKLAVIVGHVKTDKVASNLMSLSLMKSIPHLVLYINKNTEHAFLFDKQEIVKHYALKQKEENKGKDIQVI